MQMKTILIALLLCFTVRQSFPQIIKGELIPVITHSHKMDSLLKDVAITGDKYAPGDSCFTISVDRVIGDSLKVSLFLTLGNQQGVNIAMNTALLRKDHLGFFEFNGYKVFVTSAERFNGLFGETKNLMRFNFIDFSKKIVVHHPLRYPIWGIYMYKGDKIMADLDAVQH